nr:VanZ family protein [Siminovitchia terrae]
MKSCVIESYQLLFSYFGLIWTRGCNVDDIIVNTAGGMMSFLLWKKVKKLHSRRKFYKIKG